MSDVLDHVSEGVLVVDADWRVREANAAAATLLDREAESLLDADVRALFPESVESTFHAHFEGEDATPTELAFEEYFPALESWLAVRTSTEGDALVVCLREVTGRRDLEAALGAREAELERLSRIDDIIQEIIRDLVGATTREEIEATVCRRLAASELYEFTWIGERDPGSDRVSHRTAAGETGDVLDVVVDGGDAGDGRETPEAAVVRTGDPRLVRELVADETVPESLRRVAFARGLQSAIAVPLRYGTTTYGVLGVYATRPDAFSDRERGSLETLGVVTGFVINAARQRNILLSDTVVELTFRVTDPDDGFVAASSRLACALELAGVVPVSEGALLCYVEVEDAPPEAALELLDEQAGVSGQRVVHENADDAAPGGLVQVTLTGESSLRSLAERGASIRTAAFEDGAGRLVAELAPGGDVREVVEAVAAVAPGTDLLAKRERQRAVETAQEFRNSLHDRLTDRQRTALRVAYHGGYFQSPRESTAEELAAGLGISSPTLHYHLRAGQWKLVDAFLDEDPGSARVEASTDWHGDGGER